MRNRTLTYSFGMLGRYLTIKKLHRTAHVNVRLCALSYMACTQAGQKNFCGLEERGNYTASQVCYTSNLSCGCFGERE